MALIDRCIQNVPDVSKGEMGKILSLMTVP